MHSHSWKRGKGASWWGAEDSGPRCRECSAERLLLQQAENVGSDTLLAACVLMRKSPVLSRSKVSLQEENAIPISKENCETAASACKQVNCCRNLTSKTLEITRVVAKKRKLLLSSMPNLCKISEKFNIF